MARGARSVSTPARGLSQAGCCVRAVDVGVMVDVSSGPSSCVFFLSVVSRRREEVAGVAREGPVGDDGLNLR
eukprot:scaffold314237_cov159-Cyclotella_meneghiniana.AAC.1